MEADYDQAIKIGFSILANYIFGGNKKSSKISMTAPVTEEIVEKDDEISENIPMAAPVIEEAINEAEKIDMSVPVTEEIIGLHNYRISFTMPSKYTLETLPIPNDERIKFKEINNPKMAVLKFRGRVNHKLAQEKIEQLNEWLKKNNIKPKSNFLVAQYNHPAVPGVFRRNEILIEI